MLILPDITIPPNPAPAVISAEMWRFRTYCLWLEPGSQDVDGGIYANKPGYHNTRNNLWNHKDANGNYTWRDDYSIRLPLDKEGPSDKAAGFDWTFRTAQGGDYKRIIYYSDKVEAAFNKRDPRLYGFREVLCQADTDLQAEGFDFYHWTRRTPDDSHLWHMHFSKLRKYINDRRSYDAMLSILIGQSLTDWESDDEMTPQESKKLSELHHVAVARGQTANGMWFTPGLEDKLNTVLANLTLLNGKDFVDEHAIVTGVLHGLGTKEVEDIADALRSTMDAEKIAALKEIL